MFDELLKVLQPIGQVLPTGARLEEVFREIYNGIEGMNYRFVGARERVSEFSKSIGDAVPLVERLGGEAADVSMVIDKVAAATRRNVVASAEEVEKLFAAQQLTGTDAQALIDKFQNVGFGFSQIGGQLETSIKYIQSVGGNARDIMQQVNGIVENINKYNFQDGVLGLTRMATQAQLLKFDMNQTLTLAEKALNPEGAIELASAFQRMGVSVGELTDPFQLMNKAINDPEGLQNSLIEMTKQYTYFDEKTKSFKIDPQGMLMLREIASQANLSSAELSKLAVNAADLDSKLSQISPSFEFENEEDKQYIANIAKMGKGGEYEVTVKRDGKDQTVALQQATNDELKELVERQKASTQDLSLVEMQKTQLDILTLLTGELKATRDAYTAGVATSKKITEVLSGNVGRTAVVGGVRQFAQEKGVTTTPQIIREQTDKAIGDLAAFAKDVILTEGKVLKEKIEEQLKPLKESFENAIKPITDIISKKIEDYEKGGGKLPKFNFGQEDQGGAFVLPQLNNINSNSIIAEKLELKNPNDFMASTVTNKTITEQISNLNTSTAKTEIKETKVNFGDIPPLKIIFEKGSDFSEKDMAMLEYNLTNNKIGEMLTEKLAQNLKLLQTKDA